MSASTSEFLNWTTGIAGRRSILIHCQYVYGIGHLVRAFALARVLARHFHVHVVAGGLPVVGMKVPEGVGFTQLPAVYKREGIDGLVPADPAQELEACMLDRAALLGAMLDARMPDILLTEHFPFGLLFEREVMALIGRIRAAPGRQLVVSSVRDVIDSASGGHQDHRICAIVEGCFDLVLVHGDAAVIPLKVSFPLHGQLSVRCVHTGYVVDPAPPVRTALRERPLLVASVGGGRVGAELLQAVAAASALVQENWQHELILFRGAFSPDEALAKAPGCVADSMTFDRKQYRDALAVASGLICLGGYNSIVEALSLRLPTLVYQREFLGGNEEQALRIKHFRSTGWLDSFDAQGLTTSVLAPKMIQQFQAPRNCPVPARLDGAEVSCRLLMEMCDG